MHNRSDGKPCNAEDIWVKHKGELCAARGIVASLREHHSGNPSKVAEARNCADDMRVWRINKR